VELPGGNLAFDLAAPILTCWLALQYQNSTITLRWPLVGYDPGTRVAVHDLYLQKDLGEHSKSLSAEVLPLTVVTLAAICGIDASHACTGLNVTPV
jgi:hypothetical protein